jgi:hypothetical protein
MLGFRHSHGAGIKKKGRVCTTIFTTILLTVGDFSWSLVAADYSRASNESDSG